MADRLSANQMAQLARSNPRFTTTEIVELTTSAGTFDISSRTQKKGKLKTTVYNLSPEQRGRFDFPVMTFTVDNADGYLDVGGTVLPLGLAEYKTAYLRYQLFVQASGETAGQRFIDFTGYPKEPEETEEQTVDLVCEHVLSKVAQRKFRKSDRFGGDTGYNLSFA